MIDFRQAGILGNCIPAKHCRSSYWLAPSLKFSSNAVVQNGVGFLPSKKVQSPDSDTFHLSGADCLPASMTRPVTGRPVGFAGRHSQLHPKFPQIKIIQPEMHPKFQDQTTEKIIGTITILDKERRPVQATVTSQWRKSGEKVYEGIRVITKKTHPGTGHPEDYVAGWMELRFFLNKTDKYNLKVQGLITNHEDFHGIGTALMRIAMQRHLLFPDCELPIRLDAGRRFHGHVAVSRKQRDADDATSPVFFYRKLGFCPDEPNTRVYLNPYRYPDRYVLLTELLENGYAEGDSQIAQGWRRAIPFGIPMALEKNQFEKHLPTLWQEPVDVVAVPKAWIKQDSH